MNKDNKFSTLLMAVARGKESTEGGSFKRYIGVAPCYVRAVNPSKESLERLLDRQLDSDPEYVGTQKVEESGVEVIYPNVRISFLVEPDPVKTKVDSGLISVSLFIRKQYRYNKDQTKVQVIDKYGRTAWVTIDECRNHEIPMYSNGPANLDKDYRPAYVGEEDLTKFIIAYLDIPSVMKYNKKEKKWYMKDNPQDSECRLDHIEDYFKGDFSELNELISYQPNNKLQILFGVRSNDEGKLFQTFFKDMFLKNNVDNFSKLEESVKERKEAGAYSTTEFIIGPFREYSVEETKFEESKAQMPFSTPFSAPGNAVSSPWDE